MDIETINEEELIEILKNELSEVELMDFEEQVGKIFGGIALEENNTIFMEPQCCGDMGNITEWESISEAELNVWNQLWIGHPWVYYRKSNGIIEFTNYRESNPGDFKDRDILVRVAESDLQMELKKVRKQQNDFEYSIRKALEKMGIANAGQISKLMTGNE